MIGREIYLKGRDLLYRGLLAADRFFYRPDGLGRQLTRPPRTVGILVPVNTPEGTIAFSRAKQVGQALRSLGIATHLLRYRRNPQAVADLVRTLGQARVELVMIPDSFDLDQEGLPQILLELLGIAHTGSDGVTTRICADKVLTKRLARSAGVATPESVVRSTADPAPLPPGLSYPVIVKPRSGTSTIGVQLVGEERLSNAIAAVLELDRAALVEQYLDGKEVTVGVVGTSRPRALGVVGFGPGILTSAHKLRGGQGCYEEPAHISDEATRAVRRAAVEVYEAVGCSGAARLDFVWYESRPYLLEVNAVPGLFPGGALVISARLAGLAYDELLALIIKDALR